jgi:hypothetical protein
LGGLIAALVLLLLVGEGLSRPSGGAHRRKGEVLSRDAEAWRAARRNRLADR